MRLEELIGRQLGRYQIIDLIGRGGMAAVYRARDGALLREVALKILYPQYAGDQSLVERFQHEAVVAAQLDHPSIVPIYDVGEEGGLTYIAMKLLGRRTLADLLRERGTLPLDELAPIVDQIASALDYAHARDVVHRDIKPANIIIEGPGAGGHGPADAASVHAVLTDFGIAKSLGTSGLTGTGVLIGTPDYMAPEQIRGDRQVDGRADVYALGVLIFRCLTGRRPYEGSTQEVLIGHLEGAAPALGALAPGLPPGLEAVVRRAMARRPEGRFQTAGELARALHTAAGFEPLTPPPGSLRTAEPRAVVPRVAADELARHSAAEGATVQGDARPPRANGPGAAARGDARPPRAPAIPAPNTAPRRPERRQGGTGLVILGALLVLLLAGGGLLVSQMQRAAAGGTGSAPTLSAAATPPPAPPTEAPAATETPSTTPTPEPSARPSATTVQPSATSVPPSATSAPPTATRRPATQVPPTVAPTATPTPQPPTTTATATFEPTATATPTAELTPTPCPVPMAGGFGMLWSANDQIRQRLGCPTRLEVGGQIVEQPFERGSMYYFEPLELIYVLGGAEEGSWQAFSQADLAGLPTPTPAPDPGDGLVVPVGGFGLVWGAYEQVRQQLGLGTFPEAGPFDGARQPFDRGVMIWSSRGLGRGRTVYVLYSDNGTFERYDDPNQ